jgi:menaquinone-dependent protoporphyrinogen oxidase
MRVLVSAGTKHGATAEIAEVIGDELRNGGHDVSVVEPAAVTNLAAYDAYVLGSAVYAGRWLGEAVDLVEANAAELSSKPVWLFSSGPIGAPPKPEEDPVDAEPLLSATGAREHRVFAGKIDRSQLGLGEKAIVIALRAPEGDFRDWNAIRAWAAGIGRALGS